MVSRGWGPSRTNGDGLDLHTLLDMGAVGIVGVLVAEHSLTAQGVNEGRPAYNATFVSKERDDLCIRN